MQLRFTTLNLFTQSYNKDGRWYKYCLINCCSIILFTNKYYHTYSGWCCIRWILNSKTVSWKHQQKKNFTKSHKKVLKAERESAEKKRLSAEYALVHTSKTKYLMLIKYCQIACRHWPILTISLHDQLQVYINLDNLFCLDSTGINWKLWTILQSWLCFHIIVLWHGTKLPRKTTSCSRDLWDFSRASKFSIYASKVETK